MTTSDSLAGSNPIMAGSVALAADGEAGGNEAEAELSRKRPRPLSGLPPAPAADTHQCRI